MKIKRKEGLTGVKFEHNRALFWIIILLLALLIGILVYIRMHPSEKTNENAQIANHASVYCVEQGGELQIVTDPDGSQRGVCTLKSGIECDEWKYYRSECP